jgi:PAS domain-containing protein
LYTGREEWVTGRTLALLSVVPLAGTVVAVAVPELAFVPIRAQDGSGAIVDFEWKVGAWAALLHDWIVCGVAIWLLFEKFLTSRNVYRKISFFDIVGGVVLNVGALLSLAAISPFDYLLTSVTVFSVVIVVTGPTVVSYRYLELIPVERLFSVLGRRFQSLAPMARDTIVQNMQSGVVVVDQKNRVVDLNPLGRRMIGAEGQRVVGKELTAVVPPSTFENDETFLYPETTSEECQGVWTDTDYCD